MILKAKSAGCDAVLPHSAFTQKLPELVEGKSHE
jgi:hypothetical protein